MHPPRPPGKLPTSEWNSRTTGPVFTVYSSVITDLGDGRQKEVREIYRPKERGDAASLIYQGYRWTTISKVSRNTTPPPTSPPQTPTPPTTVPTFGGGIGSIFTGIGANNPFVGPLPPDFSQQTTTTPPTFNQGLSQAITALVPAQFQQPVSQVLTSVLGTGPLTTTTPSVPVLSQVPTTTQPTGETATPAIDPNVKTVLIVLAGVGAVYFFFIRK